MSRTSTSSRRRAAGRVGASREARPPRRMRATDALFWYAEEAFPGFRSTIAALYVLDGPPDQALVRKAADRALREIPRLRQRVVDAPYHLLAPAWVDDPHLDLGYHVRREGLPAPASEAALMEEAAALYATPLDRARPLWEMHVFEGLEGGRAAVFFKTHHSMVDGVGALALLDSLTDPGPRMRRPRRPRVEFRPEDARSPAALARDAALGAAEMAGDAFGLWRDAVLNPGRTWNRAAATARGLVGLLDDMGQKSIEDPLAAGVSGMNRRLDMHSVAMADLQRARKSLGATINDLVLSAVSGAVGRYHAHRGVGVEALNAMVPMSLRDESERGTLGNRVGMMNIQLPVGEPDPAQRLQLLQSRTSRAKKDRRGAMYPFLNRITTLLPGFAFRKYMEQASRTVNLVCTNIPGTPEQRYFAGRAIERIVPYAPITEAAPLSIALLSYRDELDIGIATDPEAIPDPDKLRAMLADAFLELFDLAERLDR